MNHKILEALDTKGRGDIFADIATLVDWKQASNHQDLTVGIKSSSENGVGPGFIPMLTNYFQDRNTVLHCL